MKYYKNKNNEVFSFSEDGSHDYLIGDKTKITEEEFFNVINSIEEIRIKVAEAKAYLANTDYKMLPNYVSKPDENLGAIITKRNEAREFIRNNNA